MPTPLESLAKAIHTWEGRWQASPNDRGNWVVMPDGSRRLVGTMCGVTPAAYAAHIGVPAHTITASQMQTITPEIAADIGLNHYYRGTGLDTLPWGPATDSLVDFGWGSGPVQAVRSLQRLVGAKVDGIVGQETREKYCRWINELGWTRATDAVCEMRKAFYRAIVQNNPSQGKWLQGWLNRAEWHSTRSRDWWPPWAKNLPPLPPVVTDATPLPPSRPQPVNVPEPEKDVSDASKGAVAGTLAAGGAAAPAVITALGGLDKDVALAIIGVAALFGLAAAYYLLRIRKRRKAEAAT